MTTVKRRMLLTYMLELQYYSYIVGIKIVKCILNYCFKSQITKYINHLSLVLCFGTA